MEAILTIKFERINKIKVDDKLLKQAPQLKDATEKTMQLVCDNLKKYFKEKNIDIKADFCVV